MFFEGILFWELDLNLKTNFLNLESTMGPTGFDSKRIK